VKTPVDTLIAAQFILLLINKNYIDSFELKSLYPQLRGDEGKKMFDQLLDLDLLIINDGALLYQYKRPIVTTIIVPHG
jgi:hypothetical protein